MNFTVFDSFIFKTQISRPLTDVELAYGKGVVFYFFPGKDTEPLTHSFSRFAVFFFPDPEKKNTVQKFQIIQVWASEPW